MTTAIEGQLIRSATFSNCFRGVKYGLYIDKMEMQVVGTSEAHFATISESAEVRACIVLNYTAWATNRQQH